MEEEMMSNLQSLNKDLLADIMSRLDGSTLASATCTCSAFLDVARDQTLWRQLCYSTWPSTALEQSQHLFSSSSSFRRFYSDSYPVVLPANEISSKQKLQTCVSPCDFVSLVDVYYKNDCVLSKVLHGAESKETNTGYYYQKWFMNSAFKLDLSNLNHHKGTTHDEEIDIPISILDGKLTEDRCQELVKHLRLSWVIFDKKKGKAVNLSSWKPLSIQRTWPYYGTYTVHFGCIIPLEDGILPHKMVKCVISARCKLMETTESLRWTDISMHIEDTTGAHVNVQQSLIVLNQALYCFRSKNQLAVQKGYRLFEETKRVMIKKKQSKEILADWLCISIQVTVFVIFCYSFVSPF